MIGYQPFVIDYRLLVCCLVGVHLRAGACAASIDSSLVAWTRQHFSGKHRHASRVVDGFVVARHWCGSPQRCEQAQIFSARALELTTFPKFSDWDFKSPKHGFQDFRPTVSFDQFPIVLRAKMIWHQCPQLQIEIAAVFLMINDAKCLMTDRRLIPNVC